MSDTLMISVSGMRGHVGTDLTPELVARHAAALGAWVRLAGTGRTDAARPAVHKRGSGLALQGGDLLRDCRLGIREGLGGGGERPLFRDLLEHPQAANIKHKYSLSQLPENVI